MEVAAVGIPSLEVQELYLWHHYKKTHPGRFATPFDTKKEPEQRSLDKETCIEKFFAKEP